MRCKVFCSGKDPVNKMITFSPVYSGSKENEEFFKYTPGGMIYFNVLNDSVYDNFEQGKEYYLDFTPAVAPVA